MLTYVYGYQGARKTREQLLAWWQFSMVDPEMQRRLLAFMDAAHAAGHDLGIGGGGRTTEGQLSLFLSRHHEVPAGANYCCKYGGKLYMVDKGEAHAAPPGRSYHEPTTPLGHCLAVDTVGWQDHWAMGNAHRFGLDTAEDASTREEWHTQPIEIPASRTYYNPKTHHPLPRFALPGDPPPITPPTPQSPGDPDMPIAVNNRVYDTRYEAQAAGGTPFAAGEAREVPVSYGGTFIIAQLTVVPSGLSVTGYLKVWEPGQPEPGTSVANWHDGVVATGSWTGKMRDSRMMVKASQPCHIAIDNQAVFA